MQLQGVLRGDDRGISFFVQGFHRQLQGFAIKKQSIYNVRKNKFISVVYLMKGPVYFRCLVQKMPFCFKRLVQKGPFCFKRFLSNL